MELDILKKLIVSETYDESRLREYLKKIVSVERGLYHKMKDDVQRAIVAAFELVIEHELNPWSLDIVEFVKLYLEKVKNEEFMDFITAGNLILMAWQVLEKKSSTLLYMNKPEIIELDWDPYVYEHEYRDYDLTEYLIRDTSLHVPVRREEKRPVTILELVNALQKSINDKKVHERVLKRKQEFNKKLSQSWNAKLHKERVDKAIKNVWNRILKLEKDEIELSELHDGTVRDFIQVFVPLLYLYKNRKITMFQDRPYDKIHIEVLVPIKLRKLEVLKPPRVELIRS